MTEKIERLILWQGDKKELEEFTEEIYDFISTSILIRARKKKYGSGGEGTCDHLEGFLIAYANRHDFYVEEGEDGTVLMLTKSMRKNAVEIECGIDALIHYRVQLTAQHEFLAGYSIGTPVKKRKL